MSGVFFRMVSLGRYVPNRLVPSAQIDALLQLPSGFTQKKMHIESRYWAQDHESTLFMAKQAVDDALKKAHLTMEHIDCVINAGCLVPQIIPSTASLLLAEYKASRQDCFDIDCTCLSFLKAMDVATHLLQSCRYRNILIFSSELASYGIDQSNQHTLGLFGDGAMAMILSVPDKAAQNSQSKGALFQAFPDGGQYSQCRGAGTATHPKITPVFEKKSMYFEMNGPQLFKVAYKAFPEFLEKLLDEAQISKEDIDYVIPHQASYQSIVQIQKVLGLKKHQMVNIIGQFGNQVSVSLPHAFYHLLGSGSLERGQNVLFLGAAAGVILGGMVIEY